MSTLQAIDIDRIDEEERRSVEAIAPITRDACSAPKCTLSRLLGNYHLLQHLQPFFSLRSRRICNCEFLALFNFQTYARAPDLITFVIED